MPAGESIDIMVSTNPPRKFRIEIFRMGYYGGSGARLVRVSVHSREKPNRVLPRAQEPARVPVGTVAPSEHSGDWTSGVYLGRLTTVVDEHAEPYWQSYVVFIVRDERPADILFQCSDNTWQAYNRWPNNFSLYTHPRDGRGPGLM